MPTIAGFEDLEIWQLARIQVKDFAEMVKEGTLAKDFELKKSNERIIRLSDGLYC